MGKPIGIGQSHNLIQALANNIDWSSVDSETAQWIIEHAGEAEITAFINNRAKIIVGEPRFLSINRSKPFNPKKFIGKEWSFWRGPADGDGLSGEIEQDSRSLALTEIDLTKINLKICPVGDEKLLKGEDFLQRLRTNGGISLDAGIFQTFWENPQLFPQKWKEKTNGNTTYIFFLGTVLRDPDGLRYVLCLFWEGVRLGWDCCWLGCEWLAYDPAAVLA
ncbi:hypothetical protein A2480_00290 [Candidatus Uhrbacteria bacterium RIFOXYC2_FULL_47_19]|uniref:Uncharacterized protein n=1 Tax=Candidatus Uhrbacteria bacterium RIFOXYC2_FULL_47_19 TaxID=1802424 RepID=A0A1F7WFM1_9BACT|nr:MAG: hypothetical protein A2480_00290 [Candidatus Uhrbacteria bacterium RIFOXYC2_FULL_47_19]